jgi:hypothetical protein
MAIDFNGKDILHKIQVKFIHAFLPERRFADGVTKK